MIEMNPWNPAAPANGKELLALMKRITAAERTLSVYALSQLGEIQRRKLYEDAGYPTMFAYCTGELGYSEPNASRRLQAADAARKFPEVLSLIRDGRLTMCALALISKHLTRENSERILKQAEGKSVRAVERIVAELAPLPDTRDTVRSLPAPKAVSSDFRGKNQAAERGPCVFQLHGKRVVASRHRSLQGSASA